MCIAKQVNTQCQRAESLCEKGEFAAAIEQFQRAWEHLPKEEHTSQTAAWILSGQADAYFQCARYAECLATLHQAQHCAQLAEHPLVQLRLGQCYYELNDNERSTNHLLAAYQAGGKTLFADEAPHYLASIRHRLDEVTKEMPESLRRFSAEELQWLQVVQ